MQKILIRADGNSSLGMGHVMRCLRLGRALKARLKAEVAFIYRANEAVKDAVAREGFASVALKAQASLEEEIKILEKCGSRHAVLVTDLWETTDAYLSRLDAVSGCLVVLDDRGGHNYPADLVVGQYFASIRDRYGSFRSETRFLMGPAYVILDSALREWHQKEKYIARDPKKILISFGGSDPRNLTLQALQALAAFEPHLEIRVALGVSNTHEKPIQEQAARMHHEIRIQKDVKRMTEAMHEADIAFANVGNTAYELACLGTPALLMTARPDQEENAKAFQDAGIHRFVGAGSALAVSDIVSAFSGLYENQSLRSALSENGKRLVDGEGLSRITEAVSACVKEGSMA